MRRAPAEPAARAAVIGLIAAVIVVLLLALALASRGASSSRTIGAGPRSSSPRGRVIEAINLAGATFGDRAGLWRVAWCETGGTMNPRARNASSGALGLFQFLASTWQTTPYARFPRTSPYASALAAGWARARGRAREWVCR